MSVDENSSLPKSSRRGLEEDWTQYGESMQLHTKKLLARAAKVTELRARLAAQPHDTSSASDTIPAVTKTPTTDARGVLARKARPDPAVIEQTIRDMNSMTIKTGVMSRIASIKTPFNPVAESKKKVLNKRGLRLTLDDRRPTVG